MAASEEKLGLLHDAVANLLANRIEDGTATAADVSNALKMLKDSNIEADRGSNKPLQKLASVLPFTAEGIAHG